MILDEHYNNMKALDALNQELFQLWMVDKETILDWGVSLSRCLQVLAASFPDHFPPDHVAELKWDDFYGRLLKRHKAMVAYLKASPHEKTYSDYLWAVREAEKEESMELSLNPHSQVIDNNAKPKSTSFFPLQKLKGNQAVSKMATICLAHLEEEITKREEEDKTEDPDGIDGVTEEFMVNLALAVKDTQVEEKHCYHCSSPKHFIHDCLLVRASKENMQFNCKEGTASRKGAQTPQLKMTMPKNPLGAASQGIRWPKQTPFLNPDPFECWHRVKNVAKVKINGKSCMALLDNGTQINTIMPNYVKNHSLEMELITDLIGVRVTWVWEMPILIS